MRSGLRNLLMGVVVILGSQRLQADYYIDTFETYQTTNVNFTPSGYKSAFSYKSAAEVVGGERDILVERISGTGQVRFDINSSIPYAATFASGPTIPGRGTLVWDGSDGLSTTNRTGLGGVDITQSGVNDKFLFGVTSDLGATLNITVYSSASDFSTASVVVPADTSFTFALMPVPFSSFATGGGSGANFANVGAIVLEVDGTGHPGTDVAFDFFITASAIPEPSTAALWLLGAAGFAAHRRRRS